MKHYIVGIIMLIFLLLVFLILNYFSLLPKKTYRASDFNITVVKSDRDYNNNGIDDYTDILNGAKKEAKRHPKYHSAYYSDGYPPENEGVCTDVIWRSLKEAGYSLKDLIDEDITNNKEDYPMLGSKQDRNIDFRRVRNLYFYFKKYTISLTTDITKISEFQPGDIVIFGENYIHIGIISDIRNKDGVPYLIHNAGQFKMEEDSLERWTKAKKLTGHFRFYLNQ